MRKFILFLIIVLQSSGLFAQDFGNSFHKSRIMLGVYAEPEKRFVDSIGNYSYKQAFMKANVPFLVKTYNSDQLLKFKFLRLSWDAAASLGYPEISFISKQHNQYYFMTGLSGFYYNGAKSIWLGSLHTSISEDDFSISEPTLRLSGFMSYIHNAGKLFDYHIGIAYTYLFGNALVLPVLGFHSHFNDKWKLTVSLPFRTSLMFRPNKSTDLEFFMAPAGNQFSFSSQGFIDTTPDFVLRLRKQQYQTGIDWKFNKKSAVSFDIRAGLLLGRKLKFIDDQNILSETGIKNSGFILAGITFKFGKHSKINDEKQEISDDLLENIDPSDLE